MGGNKNGFGLFGFEFFPFLFLTIRRKNIPKKWKTKEKEKGKENQTKMKTKVKPMNLEGGITLISLVVMIIILIIISVVAVASIVGNDGILTSTTQGTKQYLIAEYKEKIEQEVQKTIMEDAILRRRSKPRKTKE